MQGNQMQPFAATMAIALHFLTRAFAVHSLIKIAGQKMQCVCHVASTK